MTNVTGRLEKFTYKKNTTGTSSERLPSYDVFVEGRPKRIAVIWKQSSGGVYGTRYSCLVGMDKNGYNGFVGEKVFYSLKDAKRYVENNWYDRWNMKYRVNYQFFNDLISARKYARRYIAEIQKDNHFSRSDHIMIKKIENGTEKGVAIVSYVGNQPIVQVVKGKYNLINADGTLGKRVEGY